MNIDDLESKAKAATPGPWEFPEGKTIQESPTDWLYTPYLWTPTGGILSSYKHHTGAPKPDWDYIASASPDVVLKLLAVVRAAIVLKDEGPCLYGDLRKALVAFSKVDE